MTFDNDVIELKKVHEDYVENPYFTAFSLTTPHSDWLCIDKKDTNLEDKVKEAKILHIFNLVVKEDKKTIGSINVEDLGNENWRDLIVHSDDYFISASMSLFDLVGRMMKDSQNQKRERSPLYFVGNSALSDEEPVGIATFWDLNRAPAYILSYSILVYLEHTLLLKIRDSHNTWCEHIELLKQIANEDPQCYIKKFVRGPKYNYRILSKWGLPELLTFYRKDPHIDRDILMISDDLIAAFSDESAFRNRIGHSVKLLVEDKDKKFQTDLRRLNVIWNLGRTAFITFIDPKVRHSSPIFGDFKS